VGGLGHRSKPSTHSMADKESGGQRAMWMEAYSCGHKSGQAAALAPYHWDCRNCRCCCGDHEWTFFLVPRVPAPRLPLRRGGPSDARDLLGPVRAPAFDGL